MNCYYDVSNPKNPCFSRECSEGREAILSEVKNGRPLREEDMEMVAGILSASIPNVNPTPEQIKTFMSQRKDFNIQGMPKEAFKQLSDYIATHTDGEKTDSEEEEREVGGDLACIRYTIDYCHQYEDRGCVINLPQLLNKKGEDFLQKLSEYKSSFEP